MSQTAHLGAGAAILLISLLGRAVTANKYVRRRLSLSAFLAAASILTTAGVSRPILD